MRQNIRDILVSIDLGLIYQHASDSFQMWWEQVESAEDEMDVPFALSFLSCLVLFRQECKPDIGLNAAKNNDYMKKSFK